MGVESMCVHTYAFMGLSTFLILQCVIIDGDAVYSQLLYNTCHIRIATPINYRTNSSYGPVWCSENSVVIVSSTSLKSTTIIAKATTTHSPTINDTTSLSQRMAAFPFTRVAFRELWDHTVSWYAGIAAVSLLLCLRITV